MAWESRTEFSRDPSVCSKEQVVPGHPSPVFACPPTGAVGHSWAQSLVFTPVSPTTVSPPPVRRERESSH